MTPFQMAAVVFFVLALVATYRQKILAFVRGLVKNVPTVSPASPVPPNKPAINLVHDLLTINELRERLNVVGCQEGVDACTILLRVMIEFDYQK